MNITSTYEAWLLEKEALVTNVRAKMGEHRFCHTLSVAKETLSLAEAFVFSENDAKRLFVAALLHDYTKAYSKRRGL